MSETQQHYPEEVFQEMMQEAQVQQTGEAARMMDQVHEVPKPEHTKSSLVEAVYGAAHENPDITNAIRGLALEDRRSEGHPSPGRGIIQGVEIPFLQQFAKKSEDPGDLLKLIALREERLSPKAMDAGLKSAEMRHDHDGGLLAKEYKAGLDPAKRLESYKTLLHTIYGDRYTAYEEAAQANGVDFRLEDMIKTEALPGGFNPYQRVHVRRNPNSGGHMEEWAVSGTITDTEGTKITVATTNEYGDTIEKDVPVDTLKSWQEEPLDTRKRTKLGTIYVPGKADKDGIVDLEPVRVEQTYYDPIKTPEKAKAAPAPETATAAPTPEQPTPEAAPLPRRKDRRSAETAPTRENPTVTPETTEAPATPEENAVEEATAQAETVEARTGIRGRLDRLSQRAERARARVRRLVGRVGDAALGTTIRAQAAVMDTLDYAQSTWESQGENHRERAGRVLGRLVVSRVIRGAQRGGRWARQRYTAMRENQNIRAQEMQAMRLETQIHNAENIGKLQDRLTEVRENRQAKKEAKKDPNNIKMRTKNNYAHTIFKPTIKKRNIRLHY